MYTKIGYVGLLVLVVSCSLFKKQPEQTPIARVNDTYLYESEIQKLVTPETTKADSALLVSNYITRWATQQLLIDQAKINLSEDEQEDLEKLIEAYHVGLYTESYKNKIIAQELDTVIKEEEYISYYDKHKENFKLNDELVKVRYIHLDPNFSDVKELAKQFKKFDSVAKKELQSNKLQYMASNLNDSIWVKKALLLDALPILKRNTKQVLKKSNFAQLQDSLGVYLVKIEDELIRNDIAPLSYIKPTLKEIILNKRKLELVKKLEKDITKDAIKTNHFEIYK